MWNRTCGHCGWHLVLEPSEKVRERYLRVPSLGALLFTQGWALGARLYVWFLLALLPVVGIVMLVLCTLFGRRWSWKYGGWPSWEAFQSRMRLLDALGVAWVVILLTVYWVFREG